MLAYLTGTSPRLLLPHGVHVPKPNYHHAKKQKELARKARKQEKEQRKTARLNPTDEAAAAAGVTEGAVATTVETPAGNET